MALTTDTSLDEISVAGLEVACVVGVHPHEREKPQRVILDFSLALSTEQAGRTGRISQTVDYQQVAAQLVFLLQNARFRLLETAARALVCHLLSPPLPRESRPLVELVELKISKPDALDGRATPSVRIVRDARWGCPRRMESAFGAIDVIHEAPDATVARFNVLPGHTLTLAQGSGEIRAGMVVGGSLVTPGGSLGLGVIDRCIGEGPRSYQNGEARTSSLLCVFGAGVDIAGLGHYRNS